MQKLELSGNNIDVVDYRANEKQPNLTREEYVKLWLEATFTEPERVEIKEIRIVDR